jgi:hypothetical protein
LNSTSQIAQYRRGIYEKTVSEFPRYVQLHNEAIALLIDASGILEKLGMGANHDTAEGASKSAAFRFMSSIPTTAHWIIESARSGDYGISKSLLRLLLEESVKLAFYVQFPIEALKQVVRDRDTDDVDLSDMLDRLNIEKKAGVLRLHGQLSALYVHANLNLPTELLDKQADGKIFLVGGPRYRADLFEPIAQQILILLVNTIKSILQRFPEVGEDTAWSVRLGAILPHIIEVLPA